ncbi:MAG: FecR domain-containing protein, partial [Acidobacteriota bacterium]|nr:FecR domain-containing protein [Acidobacteriota bacterium]
LVLAFAHCTAEAQVLPPPAPGNGRVLSLTGELAVHRGSLPPAPLKRHDVVRVGDEIRTGASAEALIQASDGSTVRIFPDSRVIFHEQSTGIQRFLHLVLGSIKVHIEKLSGRPNPHTMTTPTAIIAVRGTTFSVFADETGATLVAVDEGVVAVANTSFPAREILLRRGRKTWVRPGQPPAAAARFRGPSERADAVPNRGNGTGPSGAPGGAGMGQGGGAGPRPNGSSGGRGGPPR